MLILSQAVVVSDEAGDVTVEGKLEPHAAKIRRFFTEADLGRMTVRYRFGRFVFSGNLDETTRQRVLNFLVNECPMRE